MKQYLAYAGANQMSKLCDTKDEALKWATKTLHAQGFDKVTILETTDIVERQAMPVRVTPIEPGYRNGETNSTVFADAEARN